MSYINCKIIMIAITYIAINHLLTLLNMCPVSREKGNLDTLEVRDILKYCGKGEKLLLRSNFSPFPQYLLPLLDFHV